MNSSPSPYLKVTRSACDPPGHEQHLLVLDVDALHRADPLGEDERLGLAERRRGEPAPVALVDDRRVEALLDGGPDAEGGSEVVAGHGQVGAVAHADLVDPAEQLVGRVAGEDVGDAGLDAHAHQGQPARGLPLVGQGELVVAQLHPGLGVGLVGVGVRQAHGHVQVGDPGGQGGPVDRHDEPWVDRVEHGVDAVGRHQLDQGRLVAGIDLGGLEAVRRRSGRPRPGPGPASSRPPPPPR